MNEYRICIIGNSHTACLVQAWKARTLPTREGVTLTFFAALKARFEAVTLAERALVPGTEKLQRLWAASSGGNQSIQIDLYDAFVIAGLCVVEPWDLVLKGYGVADHLARGAVPNLVSADFFMAALQTALDPDLSFSLLQKIRSVSSAPVLVSPAPMRFQSSLQSARFRRDPRFGDPEFLRDVVERARRAASTVCRKYGGELLWQPQTTFGPAGFTRNEFGEGAKLRRGSPADPESRHMNQAYGATVLGAILNRLGAFSAGALPEHGEASVLRVPAPHHAGGGR